MTEPLIVSHVYRRRTNVPAARRTDACAYTGCGRPPGEHQRRDSAPVCDCGHEGLDPMFHLGQCPVRRQHGAVCGHCKGPLRGYAAIGNVLLCHPDDGMDCYRLVTLHGHGIDCLSCIHRRATGLDGCPIYPDCEPWRATPGLPCPYTGDPNTGGPCARNQSGSGPGRVTPAGERGAGEHDLGRDTPGGAP